MDEDQKFFDVLRSLNRDGLIDLIEAAVSVGPEFIDNSVDLDIQELDKLGERAGRILELKSGKVVRKGLDQASLWRRVRNEMNKLLCTKDKKYASVRSKLSKESGAAHTAIVSMIAAAVGAQLGLMSGLLVPLVALILVCILKVGKEAYCAGVEN